jgi:hypothetical protein
MMHAKSKGKVIYNSIQREYFTNNIHVLYMLVTVKILIGCHC